MARRININECSIEELAAVPTVGPQNAREILDYRDRVCGFKDLTDIKEVPGVLDHTVTRMREAGFYVPGERRSAA